MSQEDATSSAANRPPAGGALAGIRVLEFSQIVAGPIAGVALSDFGADVVKVEPLEGETRRRAGGVYPKESKYFQSLNRGKRSLSLDLKREEGRALIHRIIPYFDVVISNFRTGVMTRLGIDYEALRKHNHGLIYANITGFGNAGPAATRAGGDLALQAFSGLIVTEGKVDEYGAPDNVMTTFIDRTTGFATAMGVIAALYHRALTGEGQELHTSLLQSALELQSQLVNREPVEDATMRDPFVDEIRQLREAGASHKELLARRAEHLKGRVTHRLYSGGYNTAQGAIVLGALTRENRDALRNALGVSDFTDQPDFDINAPGAWERVQELRSQIQARLMTRPAGEWAAILAGLGAPASEVNFPEEMSEHQLVKEAGVMAELEHEITGSQQVVGPLVRMSRTPTAATKAAPPLGHHNREVLSECGLSDTEVTQLIESGVVGAYE